VTHKPAALLAAAIAALGLLASACTPGDDAADGTDDETTTAPSTRPPASSAPPETLAPGEAGPEEPPEVEWVVQVGSADNDGLESVAARDDELVAVGWSEGDLGGTPSGGTDALAVTVGTDAEVRSSSLLGSSGDDRAAAVGSGASGTISCGSTSGSLSGPPTGPTDAWCAPVLGDGALGPVHQQGGTEADVLHAAAMTPEGDDGYAAGATAGLFPGASDSSSGFLGAGDALIWKVDASGIPVWIRQFGTAAADEATGVAATPDGDGIVTGSTLGDLDGPSAGGVDGFVSRYDPDGLPRWSRQFGSAGDDTAADVAVGGEPARGTETFVVVGSTTGKVAPALGGELTDQLDAPRADGGEPAPSNAGGDDALVAAFDATGDPVWTTQLGTATDDTATAVSLDGSTVLVGGTTSASLATNGTPAAGGIDGFLAAVDRDTGRLRWITQFGSPEDDRVTGLAVTEDGLVVLSGTTSGQMGEDPPAGGTDGFLIAFPLPSAGGSVASAL